MNNKQVIERKITSLGGIKKNPRCKLDVNNSADSSSLTRIETIYREKIPDIFRFFYEIYGSFAFNKDIGIKCLDRNPIGEDDNVVSVDYFHSYEQEAVCSIDSILSIYPELLRQKLLPICEGEPGDLICIELNSERLYYWCHEEGENENLYLVAENFMDFIARLEVQDHVYDERVEKVKMSVTPEFLEMLRKSGYGPKQ